MDFLRIFFPAMMVVGALGSFAVNFFSRGEIAVSLQWIGACLLYTALLMRNIG